MLLQWQNEKKNLKQEEAKLGNIAKQLQENSTAMEEKQVTLEEAAKRIAGADEERASLKQVCGSFSLHSIVVAVVCWVANAPKKIATRN